MAGPRSYLPLSGMELPRFAGIPTFMRLPHLPVEEADEVQIGLIGVPWDGGTTNRPGPRHGPRQLRDASTMIRMINQATGAAAVPHGALRRPRRLPGQPGRPAGQPAADLGLLRQGPREGHRADDRRRRPSGLAAGAARAGRPRRAGGDDPFRRPHRLLRQLFRRLPLHPRHALPPRRRGGPDRHRPRGADRHPRHAPTTARTSSGRAPTACGSS